MLSWEEKIRSWMPRHFAGRENNANIQAIAMVFSTLEKDLNDFIDQTFITRANSEFLDVHGSERGFSRINYGTQLTPSPELDIDYANRIRRIKYNRTKQNIISNVESVLGVAKVRVIDDYEADFLDDTDQRSTDVVISGQGPYGNQGPLDLKKRFNCFSVVIDTPERPPLSFFDKEYFYDKDFYSIPPERVFSKNLARIIYNLIKLKAPACSGFRILVKDFVTDPDIGNEAKQEENLNA